MARVLYFPPVTKTAVEKELLLFDGLPELLVGSPDGYKLVRAYCIPRHYQDRVRSPYCNLRSPVESCPDNSKLIHD